PRLDIVSVPTGVPVAVRAVGDDSGVDGSGVDGGGVDGSGGGVDGGGGGLWLVSDTGVGYRVAAGQNGGNETAGALGIQPAAAGPAPLQALRLLPEGPDLDLQSATRTVDVLVADGDGGAPEQQEAPAPAKT